MDPNLINQFKHITNATDDQAKFFLESANGNLEQAIGNFYQNEGDLGAQEEEQVYRQQQQEHQQQQQQPKVNSPMTSPFVQQRSANTAPSSSSSSKKPEKRSGMVTLRDLHPEEGAANENANRYYAGGSKTSGQQILGRDDMNNEAQDLTAQILKKAQERSAHDFDAPQNKGKFSGAGHRLGETISNVPQEQQLSSSEGEEKTVTITFYQDGFTIDDGELRRYDDPVNREFLKAINEGYVPREVAGKAKEVLVNLVDKKSEKYIPPKKAFQAFKGEGRTLSGAVRSVPSTSTPEPVHTPTYSADLNRPHTTIQIRLHDGTRLSGTFNLDDTVKRLIQFVQAARPNVGNFQLMTTFPRKVLNDPHQTIEQAGLKNATVIQNLV